MLAANDQQPFITITKRRSSPKNKKPSEATTSLGQFLKETDFSSITTSTMPNRFLVVIARSAVCDEAISWSEWEIASPPTGPAQFTGKRLAMTKIV
jgi:hypothetical protein